MSSFNKIKINANNEATTIDTSAVTTNDNKIFEVDYTIPILNGDIKITEVDATDLTEVNKVDNTQLDTTIKVKSDDGAAKTAVGDSKIQNNGVSQRGVVNRNSLFRSSLLSENTGYNVAINKNGEISAISISTYGNNQGAVIVNKHFGLRYIQYGSTIIGQDNEKLGSAIDLNDDGDILAVGIPNRGNTGSFEVYKLDNFNKELMLVKNYDTTNLSEIGKSIKISANGNVLIVSAKQNNNGKILIFKQNNGWEYSTFILSDNTTNFGKSITTSYSGDLIFVSDNTYNSYKGAVYMHNYNKNTNSITQNKIFDGSNSAGYFGHSISTDDTGDILVVGAYNANRVFIYRKVGNDWDLEKTILKISDNDKTGWSVSINGIGKHIIIGSPGVKKIRLFKYINNVWLQENSIEVDITDYGSSVALSKVDTPSFNVGGLDSYKSYYYDVTRPNVRIFSPGKSGTQTLKAGDKLNIVIQFSEPVLEFSNDDITVSNAVLSTLSTTNNMIYIGELTPNDNVARISSSLIIGNNWVDEAGLRPAQDLVKYEFIVDTIPPLILSVDKSWSLVINSINQNSDQTLTVNTENVEDGQKMTFNLNNNNYEATVINNVAVLVLKPNDLIDLVHDTTYVVKINVSDLAGNEATEFRYNILVDKVGPSAILNYSLNGIQVTNLNFKKDDIVKVKAIFDQDIKSDRIPTIKMSGLDEGNIEATNMTRISSTEYEYDYLVKNDNSIGTLSLSNCVDLNNNIVNNVFPQNNKITIDNTPSKINVTYYVNNNQVNNLNFKKDTILRIRAILDKEIYTALNIKIQGSGFNTVESSMIKQSSLIYFTDYIIPDGNGSCNITFSGGLDIAGNEIQNIPLTGDTFEIINTNPKADITYFLNEKQVNNLYFKKGDIIKIKAMFTSEMSLLPVPKITISSLSNGNIYNKNMTRINITEYTYNYQVQNDNGIANVNLSDGTDLAGNVVLSNPNSGSMFNIDSIRPTVIITYMASKSEPYQKNDEINIIATFNEDIVLNPIPKISILKPGETSSSKYFMNRVTSKQYNYNHKVSSESGDYKVVIFDAKDNAGNEVINTPLSGDTFNVDNKPPEAKITYFKNGIETNNRFFEIGDNITFKATFDESVKDSPVPKIKIDYNGILSNLSATSMTKVTNNEYTYNYSFAEEGKDIGLITILDATDLYGNKGGVTLDNSFGVSKKLVLSFTMSRSNMNDISKPNIVTIVFASEIPDFDSDNEITVENGVLSKMKTTDNLTWVGTFAESRNTNDLINVMTLSDEYVDVNSNTVVSSNYSVNICFPRNTPILTDQGEVMIQNITNKNTINREKVLGITSFINKDNYVVIIKRNSLGFNLPSRDTFCSGNHQIYYNSKMNLAKDLIHISGVDIVYLDGVQLFNVLLKEHRLMYVNNIKTETLSPDHPLALMHTEIIWNKSIDSKVKAQLIKKFATKYDFYHKKF